MFSNMFREILHLNIYHLVCFDVIIKSDFRVIQKIAFSSLCKAHHDVIMIPIFNFCFEWKNLKKRKENYKKQNISIKKINYSGEIKVFFVNIS